MTDTVTIEIDGKPVQAEKGQMLISVTDRHDIYVPRFCYHHKLSVAANCRMCLVEVEKAPKPLPACATPVMDGMKVHTRSKLALEAQRSVMEFLLINHPLDCPICDQGGECELQDLAIGFGNGVSRYQEGKRVVRDKNIGPLVQTDMTRCIQCTRCVRFGEEIAGLPELGATGRGEFMEIGTYVERSMVSELSGNVIDLCPVGALTSKPFRFSARAWEMSQQPGIAPHDAIGSNIHFHILSDRVKRVVPAENESVNEVWLSDRDRFSYEGLYSEDRLTVPIVKENGEWREIEWNSAFDLIGHKLKHILDQQGGARIGGLASATATTEELFMFQKLLRGLGCHNIDHRIRQDDFSDQEAAPVFPWLGQSIQELEQLDAVLIVGGYPRKEQPLLNHRLRKAAMHGARVMAINSVDLPFNFPLAEKLIADPRGLASGIAGVLCALRQEGADIAEVERLLSGVEAGAVHERMAKNLSGANRAAVLIGNTGMIQPGAAAVRALAGVAASASGAAFGYLGEAVNSTGAWLSGVLPHRGPGGRPDPDAGMHARDMLEAGLGSYLLLNMEPDVDCCEPSLAQAALSGADCVVALTPYRTAALEKCANFMLPIAQYAENEGTYINVEGRAQRFSAAVSPPGESRPAWKILRMLSDRLGADGLDYDSNQDAWCALEAELADIKPVNAGAWKLPDTVPALSDTLQRLTLVPMNSSDGLSRRARALQRTCDVADGQAHMNPATAQRLGLKDSGNVVVAQNGAELELPVSIDETVPTGVILFHGCAPALSALGPWFGDIAIRRVG